MFVLTDGELGTNKIITEFGKFIDSLNTSNFDEIVDNVRSYTDIIQVSDWYHLLKDLRKRFSSNNISIYPNANFNAKQINEILNLDEIDITASGTVSMRDDLALNLFNSENLELLASHEEFCAFAFLFPFTLETIALQSETLTTNARYSLIKIALNVLLLLRENLKSLRSKKSKKSPNIHVQFALEMTCRRTMNTIIALGFAMKYFNENISISRLFTHMVEFIFGSMRRLTYGDDRSDAAINAITKQLISKQILKKYNFDQIHVWVELILQRIILMILHHIGK